MSREGQNYMLSLTPAVAQSVSLSPLATSAITPVRRPYRAVCRMLIGYSLTGAMILTGSGKP